MAAQYPGELTWEEVAFSAAGMVGVSALPAALEYGIGQVAWPALVKAGSTIASWLCLRDGDCGNEVNAGKSLFQGFVQRSQTIRTALNIGRDRNIAIADYNINGASGSLTSVSGQAIRSGTVSPPVDRFFTTGIVNFPRAFDAEVKILENIARTYANQPGVYPQVQGSLTLYSELTVCSSCLGVIQQFQQMFPNISITVLSGTH
ncbi:MAG: hypothetical protein HS099_05220 [Ardenticatenaceae bacterium]|nr:hypothetical protein [Ardenticatenaceae bacterium]